MVGPCYTIKLNQMLLNTQGDVQSHKLPIVILFAGRIKMRSGL